MKEPKYRIENGRKIYTMESRIDCVRRPAQPAAPAPRGISNTAAETGNTPSQPAEPGDPDVVSVHMRLITAHDAYPTVGWLGPQLVKYGHNGGQAVREIPGVMATSPRPVPLMWNHSYDSRDIAGRISDPYWEDSTDILPGVNGWARVNRNYDPKAAIGLETGEITATSIGVIMEKELSHPDMDFDTFVSLAAEGAIVDGKQVAWLPVKCIDVVHHALVWAGADPNSGPRPMTNAASLDAAEAAVNPNPRGGIELEIKAIEILNSLCKDLGFDAILSEGSEIPDDLLVRLRHRLDAGTEALTRCFEVDARLARAKQAALPDKPNATTMETLNALIDKVPLARYGEAYLADLRNQALVAFDGAKTDPATKPDMTLAEKTVRGVIEATEDPEALRAWIAEYSKEKLDKFPKPDLHSSVDEGLPPHVGVADITAEQRRIAASFNRWQGGKK